MNAYSAPFRHWIQDGFCKPLVEADLAPSGDSVWESSNQNERTMRDMPSAPLGALVAYESLVRPEMLMKLAEKLGYAVMVDPSLFGGGLTVKRGGELSLHLDWDRHRMMRNWRRAGTVIVFLTDEWIPGDGGELVFSNTEGEIVSTIEPLPGRLVLFENTDFSYHGVNPYNKCDRHRITLEVPLLTSARPHNVRMVSHYLKTPPGQ